MGTSTDTRTADPVPTTDAAPAVVSSAAVQAYQSLLEAIPEGGGEGYDGILRALYAAEDAADLDAPWRAQGMESWLNHPLVIQGLRRMESDYAGGLPFFLAVDAADAVTGELVTFTTGAVSVVAQLAKAHALGAIPGWQVIPRETERVSKSGYRSQYLEVVRPAAKG